MDGFRFKQFTVSQDKSTLKVGTDAVLLGAAMTLPECGGGMLDIGTGTGVIALMAAQRMSGLEYARIEDWHVTAIDIDSPSIEEASGNFAASPWSAHLKAVNLSLRQYRESIGEDAGFSSIFTNPPFYDGSLKNPDCRKSAARHTESLSVEEILSFASCHLLHPDDKGDGGILSMILPAEEETNLVRKAASYGLFPFRLLRIKTVPAKKPRRIIAEFRLATENQIAGNLPGTYGKRSAREEEITLQEGNARSEEYRRLTEDFYL